MRISLGRRGRRGRGAWWQTKGGKPCKGAAPEAPPAALAARLQQLPARCLAGTLRARAPTVESHPELPGILQNFTLPTCATSNPSAERACQPVGGPPPAGLLDDVCHWRPAPHSAIGHRSLRPHPLADQLGGQPGVLRYRLEQRHLGCTAGGGALRRHARGDAVGVLVLLSLMCLGASVGKHT